jgi:hypothetical protein
MKLPYLSMAATWTSEGECAESVIWHDEGILLQAALDDEAAVLTQLATSVISRPEEESPHSSPQRSFAQSVGEKIGINSALGIDAKDRRFRQSSGESDLTATAAKRENISGKLPTAHNSSPEQD